MECFKKLLIFQKETFQARKKKKKQSVNISYISGNGTRSLKISYILSKIYFLKRLRNKNLMNFGMNAGQVDCFFI